MNISKKVFAVKGLDGHKTLQVVKTSKKDNVFRIRSIRISSIDKKNSKKMIQDLLIFLIKFSSNFRTNPHLLF